MTGPAQTRPSSGTSPEKVYHTVTACVRCRQRKTRCDAGLPKCEPCERSKASCEYFDSSKNRLVSRTYITSLQAKVRQLQAELVAIEKQEVFTPDAEVMVRGGGLTKFHENEESRYLGPSSGIAMTRLVMELAKQNTASKRIRDVISTAAAQEIKQKFDEESEKPLSKVNTWMSDVAAPDLPSRDLMTHLLNIYVGKSQYMLPVLHEPTFRQDVEDVYNGSNDPSKNFQVRMVIAIGMQRLDPYWAGLADSFYLAALLHLEAAVRKNDLSTIQCFVLIGQYSLLTPTRTASYWMIGHAVRLCQEFGLCDEQTVKQSPSGKPYDILEIDMRRRMYWIILSLEYGFAHALGRPSAFGTTVDHVNVNFFATCDDRFIKSEGIDPRANMIMKKCIAIHYFRMRLLQAEIRRTLYLRKRDTPVNDDDPWFDMMRAKIDRWVENCPTNDEGSGLSKIWFEARKNTMIVGLYRPSPQIPRPSVKAAQLAYEASVFNLPLAKAQILTKTVDLTWVFIQSIFMALNIVLWALSYPEIREQHPIEEVRQHIDIALESISLSSFRWPGVSSALALYKSLAIACLKAYETDKSFVLPLPSKLPHSAQDLPTPSSQFSGTSPSPGIPPHGVQGRYIDSVPPVSSIPPLTPSASNTSIHSTTSTSLTSMPVGHSLYPPYASNPSATSSSKPTRSSNHEPDFHPRPPQEALLGVLSPTQPDLPPGISGAQPNPLFISTNPPVPSPSSANTQYPDSASFPQAPQHYIPRPSGPASGPLSEHRQNLSPAPQIYSPSAESLPLGTFDPHSMYPFKDHFPRDTFSSPFEDEFPLDVDGGLPLAKQTWTNPFNQMSFDMFTIPTESPDHRSSSLSQEQQNEMMIEIERGLEQGELPDLDAHRMSIVGERKTSYNEAVL